MALVGPTGVGKSHLAQIWAERTGALTVKPEDLQPDRLFALSGPMLLDEADAEPHGEVLFHLLNKAQQSGNCLLLIGRAPPKSWSAEVADLRSRFNALPVVELHEPDDTILRGVLVKMFAERHIRPPQELLAYLLRRMERSAPAAQAIVIALDEAASATHRPVSRHLAREILQDEDEGEAGDGA